MYPVAVAVSAITTLTTPLLIKASGPFASLVDRKLPRPLQTFVGLYGSWIERLRATPTDAGSIPLVRRKIRLLALDAILLAGLVIGTALARVPLADRLIATGLSPDVITVLLYGAAVLLALPLVVGVVRVSGALALLLAFRALPLAAANRLDYAAAPRRVLVATLHLGLVTASGLVVVVITEPFVPLGRGAVILALVVAWLGVVFWRTTADLYGHTRAGAQVMLSALARTVAAPSPTPARDLTVMHTVLPGLGDPVPFVVTANGPAAGRTLRDLQLRSITGAVVLAITRGENSVLLPVGGERLLPGDIVALAGTTEAIDAARQLLGAQTPPTDASDSVASTQQVG
jgi:monovalent cation:H+ antiporter-2, CPA2 family